MAKNQPVKSTVSLQNKRGLQGYQITDTLPAGVILHGHEVASLRTGLGSLTGSYIIIRDNHVYLKGAYIPPYQVINTAASYDPYRLRELLVSKKERLRLLREQAAGGVALVPKSLYNKGSLIKCDIAVARSQNKADKRQTLKARDDSRDMARTLKTYR